jgi:uncharacterized tellurite resistance protein B-like protein
MTFLRRVLGLDRPVSRDLPVEPAAPLPRAGAGETASVRRIAEQLRDHPPAEARFLAAFAYLLNRAAHADLAVSDVEAREIARLVAEAGRIPPGDAELIVALARTQAVEHGASEDFLVTREFKAISNAAQRLALLRCCFLVAAADDEIGEDEAWLVNRLAEELDVPRPDLNRIRAEFHERLAAVRSIRRHAARG